MRRLMIAPGYLPPGRAACGELTGVYLLRNASCWRPLFGNDRLIAAGKSKVAEIWRSGQASSGVGVSALTSERGYGSGIRSGGEAGQFELISDES